MGLWRLFCLQILVQGVKEVMYMISSPCYGCTEHNEFCHSICGEYLDYVKENEKVKKERAKAHQFTGRHFYRATNGYWREHAR